MAFGAETARLVADLQLKDNFSKGIGSALGGLGRLESGLGRMSRGAGQVASGLDRLATRGALVAGAGLAAVTKTAIDFESAFAGVAKTVDETDLAKAGLSLESLNEDFRELARTIPLSFEEFAAIGEQAGALGIAAKDIIGFTEVVAMIGTTTDVSSDAAATALGQLSNVLRLTAEDYDNFGAALVDLGNKGASTESQILEISRRFGATGAQAGLTAQEVLAFGSAAANTGLQSELAGGALQRFFIRTQKFVQSNDINLENMAKTAGLTKDAFADLFAEDAASAMLKFIQGLEGLEKSERAAMLASLEFSNQTGLNQLLSGLAQNSDNLADSLTVSSEAWEANTALTAEAEKRYATTAAQLQLVKNNIRDAAASIGLELLPLIKELSDEFVTFLNLDTTQASIKEFGQDLAKGIRTLVDELKGADFSGLIDGMKLTAQVAKGAFEAFRALPPQVQQIAIAALVANKVSGGAVGQIARGLTNIATGAFQTLLGRVGGKVGGVLAGPGASPLNPLFVSVVGPPGLLGGAPVAGAAAGGGLLASIGGIPGLGAILATIGGGVVALESTVKATEKQQLDLTAAMAGISGPGGLIGLLVDEIFGAEHQVLGGRPATATPTGQFVPGNLGGTPVPVSVTNLPEGLWKDIGGSIRVLNSDTRRALKEGDLHAARIAQAQADNLHALRGTFDRRINSLIPHLGKSHVALQAANAKLDEGNARQQEMASGIREARDATDRGFSSANAQLGVIASKDPSVDVNVTVPVHTTVAINDIIRAESTYNAALSRSSQTRAGFKPT